MKLVSLYLLAALMMPLAYAQNWGTNNFSSSYGTATKTVSFDFSYGGHDFHPSFTFNQADYNYYYSLVKRPHHPEDYTLFAAEFMSHPYLCEVVKQLDAGATRYGYTGDDLINYLAAFTQVIEYKEDPSNYGYDYPKYPIETLYEGKGDCDDKSILLATLLNVYGFDAILVYAPLDKHMAVAVQRTDNLHKYARYPHDNKWYAFIDATWKNYTLGMLSLSHPNKVTLVNIPRPEQYVRSNRTIPNNQHNNGQSEYISFTPPNPTWDNQGKGGLAPNTVINGRYEDLSLNVTPYSGGLPAGYTTYDNNNGKATVIIRTNISGSTSISQSGGSSVINSGNSYINW